MVLGMLSLVGSRAKASTRLPVFHSRQIDTSIRVRFGGGRDGTNCTDRFARSPAFGRAAHVALQHWMGLLSQRWIRSPALDCDRAVGRKKELV